MVEPNETGPRKDPRDANWASMFLFGRWAWDGYLFGAEQTGTMIDKIDDTYTHGFERRKDISDTIYNFGGYPHGTSRARTTRATGVRRCAVSSTATSGSRRTSS
jgi:hypothetical protein